MNGSVFIFLWDLRDHYSSFMSVTIWKVCVKVSLVFVKDWLLTKAHISLTAKLKKAVLAVSLQGFLCAELAKHR